MWSDLMNVRMHEFFIAFIAIFSATLILSFWLGGWPFIPAGALFVYIIARLDK
jgi:hypothetical protein